MGYKITKDNKDQAQNLWVPSLEIAVANLAVELHKHRNLEPYDVVMALNYQYLRKKTDVPEDKITNYVATKLQRTIIENKGY